jgi:hypothetical protein
MNFLPEILCCSYPVQNRDYIINVVYQLKRIYNSTQVFTKTLKNNNVILCLKITLNVPFMQNFYNIPIFVEFGIQFPLYPPEAYIEMNSDVEINHKCTEIDMNNFKIYVYSLKNWNINTSVVEVISEMVKAFSKNFPLYKKRSKSKEIDNNQGINQKNVSQILSQNQPVQRPGLYSNSSDKIPQYISSDMKSYSSNSITFNNKVGLSGSPEKNLKVNKELSNINESTIKSILVQEMKAKLVGKMKEEIYVCKSQQDKLAKFKNELISESKFFKDALDKNDLFIVNYKQAISTLDDNINLLTSTFVIGENNACSEINEILNGMVEKEDLNIIKSISVEMYYDEIYTLIKKMIEKNILQFDEAKKLIRYSSREVYKVKFYQEKLINEKFLHK